MNIGDAPGNGVLDRDHAEIGRAVAQRREGVLEGGAGQRLATGVVLDAGDMRIRARLALVGDGQCFRHFLEPQDFPHAFLKPPHVLCGQFADPLDDPSLVDGGDLIADGFAGRPG